MKNIEYIHTKLIQGKTDAEAVKILDKCYKFEESALDLERFLIKHIKFKKEYWIKRIENWRKEKSIPMRNVNVELAKYREMYQDEELLSYTKEEIEMLNDLMHYWS